MWNDLKSYVQRCHARMLTFELKSEEGQGLVEYSLIIALVSVGSLLALGALSGAINGVFTTVKTTLEGA
jgi:Flp pilus assembly pilin Flp